MKAILATYNIMGSKVTVKLGLRAPLPASPRDTTCCGHCSKYDDFWVHTKEPLFELI